MSSNIVNDLLALILKSLTKGVAQESVDDFIAKINRIIENTNYSWVKVFAAETLDEVYGGLNELSAKYYYLFSQDILRIMQALIIAWFEDKRGFFRENINPIILAEAIERFMISIKGLESSETYTVLGNVFKKIIENLDKKTYGRVWHDLWRKAEKHYLKALSINRGNHEALEGLGDLYFMKENYEKALNYYMQAAILFKENPRIWAKIGYIFDKQGRVDKALEAYEESFKLEKRRDVAKRLYEIYLSKGLKEKAKDLEKYLSTESSSSSVKA